MKKLFLIMLCLSHSILSPDHLRDFCLEIIETIEMPYVVDKILSQSTNSEDEVTLRLGLCLSDMLAHQGSSNKKLGTDVEIQQLHEQLDEEIIAFLDQTEILYGLHNASDLMHNQILQKLALRSTCTFFNVTPLASAVNASISGGSNNVAIGFNAGANTTSGDFGIAIGGCALASAQDTIALGDTASATFQNALAVGLNSVVTGTDALAIGNAAAASQAGAIAIGSLDSIGAAASGVTASGRNAVAIGSAFNGNAGATATGMGSIALGSSDGLTAGASASMLRSVALGVGSSTAVSDSIVLGNPTSSAVAVTIGTNMPATSRLTIVPSGSQNAIAASNGSAALPAYSFIGSPSTGLYSSGTNQLSFTTNGISRLTIDSGGNMNIPGGNFTLPAATAGALITTSSGLLALGGMNPSGSNVTFFEVGTRNLFAGNYSAIPNIGTGGIENIAIGTNALAAITTGTANIAIGMNALALISAGTGNVAIGPNAANTNSTDRNFVAIGNTPLASSDSVVIGHAATAFGFPRSIVLGSIDSTNAIGAAPTSGANNAIAIGSASGTLSGASAGGLASLAIGSADGSNAGPSAAATDSIAIGAAAIINASATSAITIGTGASANNAASVNSIVIGSQTTGVTGGPSVTASRGIAIGSAGNQSSTSGAAASGQSAIAIGSGGSHSSATGPIASGISAIALGSGGNSANILSAPSASGNFSMAIGTLASSIATNAIAIGTGPQSNFANAIAIGSQTTSSTGGPIASQQSAIAIGSAGTTGNAAGPTASAQNGIAIGSGGTVNPSNGPIASATSAIALGSADVGNAIAGASASGVRSVAIGTAASIGSTSSDSIVIGSRANANQKCTIVIGSNDNGGAGAAPSATGVNAIAIGSANGALAGVSATGTASIALGGSDGTSAGANASALDAIAIGAGASVNGTNSVALGANTTVAQSNAIVLGSVGTSAVSVGIGTNTPSAKLTVVGTGAGGVTPLQLITPPTSLSTDSLVTIDGSGNIRQSTATGTFGNVIFNGGQAGPLTIGTTNVATLAFITNSVNRLTIDQTGNSTFTGNIKLPAATPNVSTANATGATSGLLEFGGANPSSTNISMFEIGTRNIFGGNYATTPNVAASATDNFARGANSLAALTTGTGNIAIGWHANSLLTTGSNTIAIGNSASAAFHNAIAIGLNSVVTGTDALAFGNNAIASQARAIAIGSQDSIGILANAAIASAQNAIAIGGSFNGKTGAAAAGVASIAFGAADGTNLGASTGAAAKDSIAIGVGSSLTQPFGIAVGALATLSTGTDSIAIGHSANSSQNRTIVLGSTDSTSTGAAPVATGPNNIAIGSASGTFAGASAAGIASIAIGAADSIISTTVGAITTVNAENAIAIGTGAISGNDQTIALGLMATATVNNNAIAIGSASIASFFAGPSAAGIASIALGSADGIATAGPVATGARSVALGTGSVATQADSIVLGNAINPSVGVTIGTNIPSTTFTTTARLTVVTSGNQNAIATSNGTLSAPAYSFIGTNTSTGMFAPATNQLDLVTSATARLIIDATGSVSYFSKYKAHAYLNANQTVAVSGAPGVTIVFDSVASPGFDLNGNFNTTTGTYTAPISGFYLVAVNAGMISSSGAGNARTINPVVNGIALASGYSASANINRGAAELLIHFTEIIRLNGGDALTINFTTGSSANTDALQANTTHIDIHFLSTV